MSSPRPKRTTRATRRKPDEQPLPVEALRPRLGVVWWILAATLCATACIVDPFADAAFDAPKWFAALAGAALAGVALMATPFDLAPRRWSTPAPAILLVAALGVVWVAVATIVSPHPAIAGQGLREFLLMAVFTIAGASRACDGAAGRRLFIVFLIACAVNAVLSLAQSIGIDFLPIAQVGGRFATGALLGNEGYVALACAMMAAACVACALDTITWRHRFAFLALAVLGALVIVINQQRTSAAALIVAILVVVAARRRWRWVFATMAGVSVLVCASVLISPIREATWNRWPIAEYQRITTYRLGAWIAAADMTAERPWTGFGPATFAAEAQKHRLAAEIRLRERLVPPTAASFVQAHQDYLELAAEAGLPALLLFVAAVLALLARLALWTARSIEQQVLLAIGVTGAFAALAWFPMHIPFTACVLLLCAGRAWRLIAMREEETSP